MSIAIKYLGHSAFEITSEKGVKILIDPWISTNPTCPIKVDDIKDIDLILVSHSGQIDHLGDAIPIAKNTGATLICGLDVSLYAMRRGLPADRIKRLIWGGVIEVGGIKIRAVEARHASFILPSQDIASGGEGKGIIRGAAAESESGGVLYGTPLGFIVYMENGTSIYHAGDTTIFSGMQLIGQLYRPNIAMFGIGIEKAEMSPAEAALAALWIGAEVVIPMHYKGDSDEPYLFADSVKMLAPWIKTIVMKPAGVLRYEKSLSLDVT